MTEISFMQVIEKIDGKLDDIREKLQEALIMTTGTQIKQVAQEREIELLKAEVSKLRTAYDRVMGLGMVLTVPGLGSALYVILKVLGK